MEISYNNKCYIDLFITVHLMVFIVKLILIVDFMFSGWKTNQNENGIGLNVE